MSLKFDPVRVFFETQITDLTAGVPVQYENVPESAALVNAKSSKEAWVRVVIRDGDGITMTCGDNPIRRYVGIAFVSFFEKRFEGTKKMRERAERISTYILSFKDRMKTGYAGANRIVPATIPKGFLVRTPNFGIIGETEDWFGGNLTIPFEYDAHNGTIPVIPETP